MGTYGKDDDGIDGDCKGREVSAMIMYFQQGFKRTIESAL